MRVVLLLLLTLPVLASADDILQKRHVVGSDGVGYTVLRADPSDQLAVWTMEKITSTDMTPGYSCIVLRDSQITSAPAEWMGIQAAMAANHFTLNQEQQTYCTDAVISPPAPKTLYASGQMWAIVNNAPGAPIGFAPAKTPCEGLKFTINGANYYTIHITNPDGTIRAAVVKVCQ